MKNNQKNGKDALGSVTLEKIDKDTKERLSGAEFVLYYERNKEGGGKEFVPYRMKKFVTDENGTMTLKNIQMGRYYFEEVKAPEGYMLPENKDDRKYYFDILGSNREDFSINLTVENTKNGGGGGTITPDPEKPEKPELETPDPEKPEKPEPETPDPEKPEKPEKPEPETPDPEKPEKPEPETPDPEKPEKPEPETPDSEKPENLESETQNKPEKPILSKFPKTGDMSSLGLASITFIGASTGLYTLRKNKIPMKRNSRRRRNRRKK